MNADDQTKEYAERKEERCDTRMPENQEPIESKEVKMKQKNKIEADVCKEEKDKLIEESRKNQEEMVGGDTKMTREYEENKDNEHESNAMMETEEDPILNTTKCEFEEASENIKAIKMECENEEGAETEKEMIENVNVNYSEDKLARGATITTMNEQQDGRKELKSGGCELLKEEKAISSEAISEHLDGINKDRDEVEGANLTEMKKESSDVAGALKNALVPEPDISGDQINPVVINEESELNEDKISTIEKTEVDSNTAEVEKEKNHSSEADEDEIVIFENNEKDMKDDILIKEEDDVGVLVQDTERNQNEANQIEIKNKVEVEEEKMNKSEEISVVEIEAEEAASEENMKVSNDIGMEEMHSEEVGQLEMEVEAEEAGSEKKIKKSDEVSVEEAHSKEVEAEEAASDENMKVSDDIGVEETGQLEREVEVEEVGSEERKKKSGEISVQETHSEEVEAEEAASEENMKESNDVNVEEVNSEEVEQSKLETSVDEAQFQTLEMGEDSGVIN